MSIVVKKGILVDESVWLTLCLDLNERGEEAYQFLTAATGKVNLYVTATCLQDVWNDLCHVLRHVVTVEGGVVDDRIEALIASIAWDSVAFVRDAATVITAGPVEAERAEMLKDLQADYREALLVATAEACRASCIVTFEDSLRDCLPVKCLKPLDAVRAFGL